MTSDVEFTSEEIDDLANDCFMVLDEVDAYDDDVKSEPDEDVATLDENEKDNMNSVKAEESCENEENSCINTSNGTVDSTLDDAPQESTNQNEEDNVEEDDKSKITETEENYQESAPKINIKQDELVIGGNSGDIRYKELIENVTLVAEDLGDETEPVEEKKVDVHPYLDILNSFEVPQDQMTVSDIGDPKSLSETPLYMINSTVQLLKVIQELKNAKEVAIYMQTHMKEYHTVICLLILSTRDADYIVDAIHLKKDLLLLTEIFIDPKIVKVVYEANNANAYLQQYFHLYLVNVFDVEKASRVFSGGKRPPSLNLLMKNMYKFQKNRRIYQNDFRQRPLTNEMKQFARAAPHYLIYLYHHFKNELLKTDKAQYEKILRECREICKILAPNRNKMFLEKLEKELKVIHDCQFEVLRKLYEWRDKTAKRTNKNHDIILPKANLIKLAVHLPTVPDVIFSLTGSLFVKYEVKQIISLISDSKIKFNIQKRIKPPNNKPNTKPRSKKNSVSEGLKPEPVADHAQKRKLDEQPESTPTKQLKISPSSNKQTANESILNSGSFLKNKNNQKTVPPQNKGNQLKNEVKSVNVTNSESTSKKKRKDRFASHQNKQQSKGNQAAKNQGYWRPEPFLKNTAAMFENFKSLRSPTLAQTFNKISSLDKKPKVENASRQNPFVQSFNVEPVSSNMNSLFSNVNENSNRIFESSSYRRDDFTTPSKILNPTNIPSTSAFQNGFSPLNSNGSFRNRSAIPPPPPPPINPSDLFNFISSGGTFGRGDGEELNILFTSGDRNDNSTGNSWRYFNYNREDTRRFSEHNQELSVIDRKINTLERKVSGFRRGGRNADHNFNDGSPRKRY